MSPSKEQPLVWTHCCRLEHRFSTRTLAMLATRVPLPRVLRVPVSRVVLAITCTVSHVSSPAPHGRSMATRLHAPLLVLLLHVKHVTPANTCLRISAANLPLLTVREARVPVGHPEVKHGVEQQAAVWGQEHGGRLWIPSHPVTVI